MKEVGESLAGRCGWLELEGLSGEEIRTHLEKSKVEKSLPEIIVRGTLPELYRAPDMPRGAFYSSYLATYIERDVRQLLNIVKLRDFERFIRILASRNAQQLNKSTLASEVGVSVKAISDWVSVLEASNIINLLEPWYSNFGKRLVKTPKVYFMDPGLACYLLGLDAQNIFKTPFWGSLFESWIFAELRKTNRIRKTPLSFWFYRDKRSREVDFLIEGGGKLHFIECKTSELPTNHEARKIESLIADMLSVHSPLAPGKSIIACQTPNEHPVTKTTSAMPVNKLISWFQKV